MGRIVRPVFLALVLYTSVVAMLGCERPEQRRPAGYLKLGNIAELQVDQKYYPDLGILLRRDQRGYYAMSTNCTYDGSSLRPVQSSGATEFASEFSDSRYSLDGSVLHGPARFALPYYQLKWEAWNEGGPLDTLYVLVGRERPSDWRLPPPKPE